MNKPTIFAKKNGKGLATYLTNWKNLLAHALLGCLLLLIAIIAPVPIWAKLILIICLMMLNILRMRWSKARNAKKWGKDELKKLLWQLPLNARGVM